MTGYRWHALWLFACPQFLLLAREWQRSWGWGPGAAASPLSCLWFLCLHFLVSKCCKPEISCQSHPFLVVNNLFFLSRRCKIFSLSPEFRDFIRLSLHVFLSSSKLPFHLQTQVFLRLSSFCSNVCVIIAFPPALPFPSSAVANVSSSWSPLQVLHLLHRFSHLYCCSALRYSSISSSRPLIQVPAVTCLFFNSTDKLNILVQNSCFSLHSIFGMGAKIESPCVFILFFYCCPSLAR